MYNERPWLKNYPSGVPANIDPNTYCNIVELIKECCVKFKDRPAGTSMGRTITYKELDTLSDNLGAYLQSRGLEPGDKIALMMPNLIQYPIAILACLKAGLVLVNTNPLYTPREMKHQFTDSGAKAIILSENFAANLEKILPETEIKTVVLTNVGEMLGMIKGSIVNFMVRKVKRLVPKYNLANTVSFNECLRQGRKFKLKDFDNYNERVVSHQYTGGTTGVAKGAMLTNANLLANALQVKAIISPMFNEGGEEVLCPLPLYHIFAFTATMCMFVFGAHNVFIVNPRDSDSIVAAFKKHNITLMTGVNTLFNSLLNNKNFRALDFSSLKICIAGGMALQNAVAQNWKDVTNCRISQGYGLTETSPVASVTPIDGSGPVGSIGLPAPSTIMKIVKEDGTDAAIGEKGEIWIQGPQVMKGYYQKPEETAKTIKDGWLCSGDIGKMDENGYFFIVDRLKDMILVSGFNVYPNEIEDVIASDERVLECAAIGIPHEKSGECVKLFIVKKDKSLTADDVRNFAKDKLTGYKMPRIIEFRDELPKSNVGKILRRELRDK